MKSNEIKALLEKAQQDGIQKYVVGAFIVQDGPDFLPNLDEIPSGGVAEESML